MVMENQVYGEKHNLLLWQISMKIEKRPFVFENTKGHEKLNKFVTLMFSKLP